MEENPTATEPGADEISAVDDRDALLIDEAPEDCGVSGSAALAADREAYRQHPERPGPFWTEAWSDWQP